MTPYFKYFLIGAVSLALSFFFGWSLGHHQEITHPESDSRQPRTREGSTARLSDHEMDIAQGKRAKRAPVSRKESKDFAQSVRSIFRENVKLRRGAMFQKLVDQTGIEHLPDLISLIRENDLRGNDSGDEWSRLWTSWGERDPQAAMQFFRNYDWTGWSSNAKGEARNRTLTSWAQANPEMARRYVEADGDFLSGDRSLVYGLVEGWANVNPEAAAAWISKSGLGMGAEYEKVVAALSRRGGQEAVDAWYSKLDPTAVPAKDRMGFAQAIAHAKQQNEPEKAAEWVISHLNEPWLGESEIIGTTAWAFAERNPQGAVEWASKTGLEQATNIAVGHWCDQDRGAASTWVVQNAHLPEFFKSASQVVSYLQKENPVAARELLDRIPDPALRQRLFAQ